MNREELSIVKKCPKCGSLSLVFRQGEIRCMECGFKQSFRK